MIVIAGLGVIGGSYAMALKRAGIGDVHGIDRNAETLKKAVTRGLIESGDPSGSKLLKRADLVILALYPQAVPEFLALHAQDFRPGALITDATGVKSELAALLAQFLPEQVDFVLGHPMAGREKMGIDYASDQVFQGANYIITPMPRNRPENIERIEALARTIGFGCVRRVSPEEHDELIAYTSQLPHAMAVALVNSDVPGRDTGRFIGDSYRDLTRIARINGPLWSELFLENKKFLLQAIENFDRELNKIKSALVQDDREALIRIFEASSERRDQLDI